MHVSSWHTIHPRKNLAIVPTTVTSTAFKPRNLKDSERLGGLSSVRHSRTHDQEAGRLNHSLNQFLLAARDAPASHWIQGPGDSQDGQTSCPLELTVWWERREWAKDRTNKCKIATVASATGAMCRMYQEQLMGDLISWEESEQSSLDVMEGAESCGMTEDYLGGKEKQQVQGPCGRRELTTDNWRKSRVSGEKLWRRGWGSVRQGAKHGQPLAGSNDNNSHKYDDSNHRGITSYMPGTGLGTWYCLTETHNNVMKIKKLVFVLSALN